VAASKRGKFPVALTFVRDVCGEKKRAPVDAGFRMVYGGRVPSLARDRRDIGWAV